MRPPTSVASGRGGASARTWMRPGQSSAFNCASALGDLQVDLSLVFGGDIFGALWCFGTPCVAKCGGAEKRENRLRRC